MEEVAGDAAVDGAAPCRLGTERGNTMRSNQEENVAISVEPLWWHRLGLSFIRGIGDDAALPVVRVKPAVGHMKQAERFHREDTEAAAVADEGPGDRYVADGGGAEHRERAGADRIRRVVP